MSDSTLIMDGDGIFSPVGYEDELCESVKRAIRDKEKTLANHLETYKIKMLSHSELEAKFERKRPEYYKMIDSDFFFIGYELKEDFTKKNDFIWDDMFLFMVRMENGNWKMKGING